MSNDRSKHGRNNIVCPCQDCTPTSGAYQPETTQQTPQHSFIRKVGTESQRTYEHKIASGFFTKYMSGKGCEIGYQGYKEGSLPILEGCEGYDLTTPGYDGVKIPVPDNHYDYLYSSHVLEHISDYKTTLLEWFRVVRPGGHIFVSVPHRDLYERKLALPSRWNRDHKRFYTSASLLHEFESALPINGFRVRYLYENDTGHDYNQPDVEHAKGAYEIEMVIEVL